MDTGASSAMTDLATRAAAAVIGAAVGDALGWPQENRSSNLDRKTPKPAMAFRSWRRRSGGRFNPYEEIINAGDYSDDTQLLCTVGRSLAHGDGWYEWFTNIELPAFPPYQRGAGGAVLGACRAWTAGVAPWQPHKASNPRAYFNAGGNGGAMRVLPHAIAAAARGNLTNPNRVFADVTATHGHLRAAVGAAVHAAALWAGITFEGTLGYGELIDMLLDKRDLWSVMPEPSEVPHDWINAWDSNTQTHFSEAWHAVVDEMIALLATAQKGMNAGALASEGDTLAEIGCTASKILGAGTVSAAGAVYLASRWAANPRAGLLAAAYLPKADTDTLASMTASILGAFVGHEWMAPLDVQVQDHQYLAQLASALSATQATDRPPDRHETKSSIDRYLKDLDSASPGQRLNYVDHRTMLVESREQLPTKSSGLSVERFRLTTADGQTLQFVRIHRTPRQGTASDQQLLPLDEAIAGARPAVVRVGVKVSVADLDLMRRFYQELLGMTPSRAGSRFVTFNEVLALAKSADPGLQGPSRVSVHLEVNEIEALWRQVQLHEVRIVEPLAVEAGGRRRFRCLDPEGNLIEVRDVGAEAPTGTRP